jgi:hypothetical protein
MVRLGRMFFRKGAFDLAVVTARSLPVSSPTQVMTRKSILRVLERLAMISLQVYVRDIVTFAAATAAASIYSCKANALKF